MTPEELRVVREVAREKDRAIRRKVRNLRKRVQQGRLTHAECRAKTARVVEEVLG